MQRAIFFFLSLYFFALLVYFSLSFLPSFSLFLFIGKCLEPSKEELYAGRAIVERREGKKGGCLCKLVGR